MDFDKLIERAVADLDAAKTARSNYQTEQETIARSAGDSALTSEQLARVSELGDLKAARVSEIDTLTERVEKLRKEKADDERMAADAETRTPGAAPAAPAKVGKEARTYNPGNNTEVSFFGDMLRAEKGDYQARTRLEQHQREAAVEGEFQVRAGTTGGFAGLVPPVYLPEQYALVARAGRPTANVVHHEPLPESGMSIIIPRGTTGAATAIQATENSAVQNTDEVWSNLTVPVVTIAGQQDISRQALERGQGIDSIIYADLAEAYNVNLDQQVLSGTGSGGQMLGILNTAGVYQASAYTAAATVTTFYQKLAGAVNAVETLRFRAPDVIIMHPRRWNWLLTQLDSSNRPLAVPNTNGPFNAIGVADAPIDTHLEKPAGWILGVPVITDANIPTAVGTGPEDQIIVARKDDLILWENGGGAPFQLRLEQTLGNQLTVKLVAYNYAAFTAGRYPTAVGIVGGNSASGFGQIAPTF